MSSLSIVILSCHSRVQFYCHNIMLAYVLLTFTTCSNYKRLLFSILCALLLAAGALSPLSAPSSATLSFFVTAKRSTYPPAGFWIHPISDSWTFYRVLTLRGYTIGILPSTYLPTESPQLTPWSEGPSGIRWDCQRDVIMIEQFKKFQADNSLNSNTGCQ